MPSQRDTQEDLEDDIMRMPIKAKRSRLEERTFPAADDFEAID
jgi:hypothetical protein